MTQRTVRWLECDRPGCTATFDPARHRVKAAEKPVRSIRDAAARDGWMQTEEGDDLCKQHADAHRGLPPQPELFPVSDGDHQV